jgi:hypothetical protein
MVFLLSYMLDGSVGKNHPDSEWLLALRRPMIADIASITSDHEQERVSEILSVLRGCFREDEVLKCMTMRIIRHFFKTLVGHPEAADPSNLTTIAVNDSLAALTSIRSSSIDSVYRENQLRYLAASGLAKRLILALHNGPAIGRDNFFYCMLSKSLSIIN